MFVNFTRVFQVYAIDVECVQCGKKHSPVRVALVNNSGEILINDYILPKRRVFFIFT